jgi:hypothetical protein
MKLMKYSAMLLLLVGLSAVFSCGGSSTDPELTLLKRISGTWVITAAKENGAAASFQTTGFSMTINEAGTYSITLGSLPVTAKPNYKSTVNAGNWALASNDTKITFDGNTAASVTLVSFTPVDKTKPLETMVIEFTTDAKTNPTYRFDLAKQ